MNTSEQQEREKTIREEIDTIYQTTKEAILTEQDTQEKSNEESTLQNVNVNEEQEEENNERITRSKSKTNVSNSEENQS